MENRFTEQDSLRLIDEMIAQTRDNIQKGSANTMIFAGYSVAATALLNFILLHTLTPAYHSFWVWLLMIPMSIGCFVIGGKQDRQALVRTHVDKIVSKTWFAFFVSEMILLATVFGSVFIFETWMFTALITPITLAMLGAAQYITAVSTRFQPFMRGAYVFWVGAVLCTLSYAILKVDIQFLILAICMIAGFIVPGHILNRKAKENV